MLFVTMNCAVYSYSLQWLHIWWCCCNFKLVFLMIRQQRFKGCLTQHPVRRMLRVRNERRRYDFVGLKKFFYFEFVYLCKIIRSLNRCR